MKLYLQNHTYRYAVEQTMLALLPGEKPVYPDAPPAGGENSAVSRLFRGERFATAKTVLTYGGKTCTASLRVKTAGLDPGMALDRALQRALRLSFYRAATGALGSEPPWGAVTGVRPVKIPTKGMLGGQSPRQAEAVLRDFYRVSPPRIRLAMDCANASLRAIKTLRPDEISLYIGIPFCPTRCAYCSFVSADVGRSLGLVEPFLAALLRELQAAGALLRRAGLFVRTIYIGGGTPTTLSAPQLTALMEQIRAQLDLSRCTEYTVEAGRPDTITAEKLAAIRRGGADRVSVNPQSMHDNVLRAMGRAHSAADILSAFALVRAAGFPCVNMD
ncbi:MAG: radical SAM protein, partial [Pseudoflavonifractor sp.]